MVLTPPRLDDRRWDDLVEEARALIVQYAPGWTDHNASDPGITVIELLAWLTEMEIFQLDQVSDRHRRAFLRLAGVPTAPPRPARVIVRLDSPVTLPATTEFGDSIRFRSLRRLTGTGARITHAPGWRLPFGDDPRPGAALTLSVSGAVPAGTTLSLAVATGTPPGPEPAEHHSARTVWEHATASGLWRPLPAVDTTRALTRDGTVELTAPAGGLSRVRCRLASGRHDAAPELTALVADGVWAAQSPPLGTLTWAVRPDARIAGSIRPGRRTFLRVEVGDDGAITALVATGAGEGPSLYVYGYTPPGPGWGELSVEAAALGVADGRPELRLTAPSAPVERLRLWTLEEGGRWRRWWLRPDLAASGPADAHAVLDRESGALSFGDGANGLVPPQGAHVVAVARTTAGEAGNIPAGALTAVADSPHNRALLTSGGPVPPYAVSNPVTAAGGAPGETTAQGERRMADLLGQTTRAVTAADIEALALSTPGTRVARAVALPGVHPRMPCVVAEGVVTVVVVPHLPKGRPEPSAELLRTIAARLCRQRLVGTAIEVAGPVYTRVTVRAKVRAEATHQGAEVSLRAAEALRAFFDPLTGGRDGRGWPLGRDVSRAEVLGVVAAVPGVAYVTGLEVTAAGCRGACGDVRVGPLGLVEPAVHEIEVLP
ncbi:putative baseplate assembly protein [Sphaerisporangium rhizosphaerae]|uniref:Baseplate assembly protein n=1 Tax=Sphaerisporangium rhizosphaerae TaxID=2269375 RepID=A0ABW2PIP7_9ACTN